MQPNRYRTVIEAILPDLSTPDPLVEFTKDDIAFVWQQMEQRYFTKSDDHILAAQ